MIHGFLGFALKEKLTLKSAQTVLLIHPHAFFVLSIEFHVVGFLSVCFSYGLKGKWKKIYRLSLTTLYRFCSFTAIVTQVRVDTYLKGKKLLSKFRDHDPGHE